MSTPGITPRGEDPSTSSVGSSKTSSNDLEGMSRVTSETASKTSVGRSILNGLSTFLSAITFPFRWAFSQVSSAFNPTTEKTAGVAALTLKTPGAKGTANELAKELREHKDVSFSIESNRVVGRDRNQQEQPKIIELINKLGGPENAKTLMEEHGIGHNERMIINNYDIALKELSAKEPNELKELLNDRTLSFKIDENNNVVAVHKKEIGPNMAMDELLPRVSELINKLGWDKKVPQDLTETQKRNLEKFNSVSKLAKANESDNVVQLSQQLSFHPRVRFELSSDGRVMAKDGTEEANQIVKLIENLGGPEKAKSYLPQQEHKDIIDRYAAIKKAVSPEGEINAAKLGPTLAIRGSDVQESLETLYEIGDNIEAQSTQLTFNPTLQAASEGILNDILSRDPGDLSFKTVKGRVIVGVKEEGYTNYRDLQDLIQKAGGLPNIGEFDTTKQTNQIQNIYRINAQLRNK